MLSNLHTINCIEHIRTHTRALEHLIHSEVSLRKRRLFCTRSLDTNTPNKTMEKRFQHWHREAIAHNRDKYTRSHGWLVCSGTSHVGLFAVSVGCTLVQASTHLSVVSNTTRLYPRALVSTWHRNFRFGMSTRIYDFTFASQINALDSIDTNVCCFFLQYS